MKNFTSLIVASSLLVPGIAAGQFRMLEGMENAPQQNPRNLTVKGGNLSESVASLAKTAKHAKAAKKSFKEASENDVIYEAPEGTVTTYARSGSAYLVFWGYILGTSYENKTADIVECENGEVYLKNLITQVSTNTYLKGYKEGSSYVFDLPQTIYVEEYEGETYYYDANLLQYFETEEGGWFYAANSEAAAEVGLPQIDNKLVINIEEDGTLSYAPGEDDPIVGLTGEGSWTGYAEIASQWKLFNETQLFAPEGLETTEMAVLYDGIGNFANVGFDGDDVWVKGMFPDAPEAWIYGTLNGDKVSFKSGQYLGINESYGYFTFFNAAEASLEWDEDWEEYVEVYALTDELVFTYDAENQIFTTGENSCAVYGVTKENAEPSISIFKSPVIKKQPDDISKVPANPSDLAFKVGSYTTFSFDLPMKNVDGQLLNANNLYYKIFVDGDEFTFYPDEYEKFSEEMTLLPYYFTENWDIDVQGTYHTVYFYLEGMEEVGVQLYYYENGEEVAASELMSISTESKIGEITGDNGIACVKFYNVNGQEVRNADKGIYIKTIKYNDGSKKSFKIVK